MSATGDYVARVRDNAPLEVDRRELTQSTRLEEALFMGLRLSAGVDLASLAARYDVDPWARYAIPLEPYLADGLVILEEGRLRLTRAGMLVANEVMAVFV